MKKIFVLILFVFISCDGVQYGEINNVGNTYYFNSKTTNNSRLFIAYYLNGVRLIDNL